MFPCFKIILLTAVLQTPTLADYWTDRDLFIKTDEAQAIGADVQLDARELIANDIIMNAKLQEFDNAFINPETFLPAQHFFIARPLIEQSTIFKIIQTLPKGASLHGHDTAIASGEFLYNLTFSDKLYACTVNDRLRMHFFEEPILDVSCNWTLMRDLRLNVTYDDWVRSQITLVVPNPQDVYTDINQAWTTFIDIFITVDGLVTYKPIFEQYYYQVLEECYMDNIMYIEFRTTLPTVYELDGTLYGPIEVAGIYKNITDKFKLDHPDFHGARFIYAPVRLVSNETVNNYITIALNLQATYQDFIAGFDLVGQEDLGLPLSEFIPQIQEISKSLKLFLHAGETNWNGESTDLNLVDAVLLGTVRIGHGYAVLKHPEVSRLVKSTGIAIEVSPISNQVLLLVGDLRNHPGSVLIAEGYPVVICNDDPGFWGAKGLSYDWYMAFMGMASRNADLRLLKQLAINSINYSAMDLVEEGVAMGEWQLKWDTFINNTIALYYNEIN